MARFLGFKEDKDRIDCTVKFQTGKGPFNNSKPSLATKKIITPALSVGIPSLLKTSAVKLCWTDFGVNFHVPIISALKSKINE